jgi:hypothetical protein
MLAPLTSIVVVVIGGLAVLVALAGGGVLSVVCAALLLVVLCSMRLRGPSEIEPWMWIRRVEESTTCACADLRESLEPGEPLASPPLAEWGAPTPTPSKSPQHPIGREPCRPSLS